MITAVLQFLKESQDIVNARCQSHHSLGEAIYRVPFEFIIPHSLISAQSDVASDYLNLLPTVKEGPSFQGPSSGRIYRRPMIIYTLTASVIHMGSGRNCQHIREITIMPSIPANPPLQIEHFPREYKTTCSKVLKRHIWGRQIGALTVWAVEPPPLNISTSESRASTIAPVTLFFKPCKAHTVGPLPYDWEITVKSFLRVRTFLTAKPFTRIPTQEAVETGGLIQMDSTTTSPETRRCDTLPWRLHRLSSAGTILTGGLDATPWTTALIVPVNAPKTLVPIFTSPLATRRFSLVLHFTIGNLSHSPLVLEIPIQVIHDTSKTSKLSRQATEGGQERDPELQQGLEDMESVSLQDDSGAKLGDATKPPPYSKD